MNIQAILNIHTNNLKKTTMKTTTIEHDKKEIHVTCPYCNNCESHSIDEQRHHLQYFEILNWKNNDTSVMKCCTCDNMFNQIWKY